MRLVVFDIDGTLQDTLSWWPALCNRARVDFARERGFAVELLSDDDCNAVVGGGAELWPSLLPPEHRQLAADFSSFVIEREVALLNDGTDRLFPGTRELLRELQDDGVSIALASNCGRQYLEAFVVGQSVAEWVSEAHCLDGYWTGVDGFRPSPVADKSQMLGAVLLSFRHKAAELRAVMVGDRKSDAQAAADQRIPFVLRLGWHQPDELGEQAAVGDARELGVVLPRLLSAS